MQYKEFNVELPIRANNVTMLDGVVQNDAANMVHVQLMSGDKPFNFDGFTNIVLTVITPVIDTTTGKNVRIVAMTSSQEEFNAENPYSIQAIDPENGRIDFSLNGALTSAVGEYFAQIEILDAGESITSSKVNYRVKENLLADAAAGSFISQDDLTNLQGIFDTLSTLIASIGNWNIAEGVRTTNEESRIEMEQIRTVAFSEQMTNITNMLSSIESNLQRAKAEADRSYLYSTVAATPTIEMVEDALSQIDVPTMDDVNTAIENSERKNKDMGEFDDEESTNIVFRIRRGVEEELPTLAAGEFAFTTDGKHVYIGTGTGNKNITGHYVHQATAPTNTDILWIDSSNNNAVKFFDETAQEWKPTATSVFA